MKKTLAERFIDWLFDHKDPVQEAWNSRSFTATSVRVETDDGYVRSLTGEAAKEWHHDVYMMENGRRRDMTKHKWSFSKVKP